MKHSNAFGIGLLAAALAATGCGSSGNNNTVPPADAGGGDGGGRDVVIVPQDVPGGGGTCAQPYDLQAVGTREGAATTFRGSTAGMGDALHPYGECVARDAVEAVFSYRVPAGVQALQVSTAGSAYDTAVYVRTNCSQAPGSNDMACNNDSYDDAPQSLLYVTNLIEGQVLFVVVDGNAAEGAKSPAQGSFVLTVREVPLGAMGMPCRPEVDGSAAPRCDAPLRCSGGAGADGTALCVPTVTAGSACDLRGNANTCEEGATCVMDPTPPEGSMPAPMCATAGTRAGAPCRANAPRCDGALVCGSGDNPACVRVIGLGMGCDPAGAANQCATGLSCSPLGDAGGPICHPL